VTVQLEISESITSSLKLPPAEVESRLRTELALSLYAQGMLPLGKATELARMSRYASAELAGSRNIPRHYADEDLAQDIEYARGQ